MWVHGNAAIMQFASGGGAPGTGGLMDQVDSIPWTDLLGAREGSGSRFTGKANVHNWFHFTIPVPAVVPWGEQGSPNQEIVIDKVSVYYSTPNRQIYLDSVVVNLGNGDSQDKSANGMIVRDVYALSFNHEDAQDPDNAWMLDRPVRALIGQCSGLCLSVGVQWMVGGTIRFTGAAIHYSLA
jgi:hypothetical protein